MKTYIIPLGVDCGMGQGLQEHLGWNSFHEGTDIKLSPFSGGWIYHKKNTLTKIHSTNYNSLGEVIAPLIKNNFDQWFALGKNYRGHQCCKSLPMEYTHRNNFDSIDLFLNLLESDKKIIFTSLWRVNQNFAENNNEKTKIDFVKNVNIFRKILDCDYELKFFFAVRSKNHTEQINFVHDIMKKIPDIKYGILYSEAPEIKSKYNDMKHRCFNWDQALIDTDMKKFKIQQKMS